MPYLILIIGVLVGAFALFRFFQRARPEQVVSLSQALFVTFLLVGCLFLALTGRIGPAIAIFGAMVPMAAHFYFKSNKEKIAKSTENNGDSPKARDGENANITSESEALDILGLEKGASVDDIQSAYKNLMKKFHPDQGGNEYFARKLSAARDFLLGR